MAAPDRVYRLVEQFEENQEAVKRPDYLEYHLRVEFLHPMFDALGWDVYNEGQAPITDRQIDRLVNDLHGLTDDGVRIAEEATAR